MQWFGCYRTWGIWCFTSFHVIFEQFVTQLNKRARGFKVRMRAPALKVSMRALATSAASLRVFTKNFLGGD